MDARLRGLIGLAVMMVAGTLGGLAFNTYDPHWEFTLILGTMVTAYVAGYVGGSR